jgi:predicted kinase
MIKLILIRGLPGAGKSSIDCGADYDASADDYFLDDAGEYQFDPAKLPAAHAWCLDIATKLIKGHASVAVHNTFTQRWEMEPYIQLARETKARLIVLSLFDGGLTDAELVERNIHGVPPQAIAQMRERFEHDWKNGNPLPPWER